MVDIEGLDRGAEAVQLIGATQEILRDQGLAAVTIGAVLERTELGTRAFYRHFSSKDHLLVEVFADATLLEVERLCGLMERTSTATEAVAAWLDGRLALGFDGEVETDLRYLSQQAQALYAVAPGTMSELYQVMMQPLVEQLEAGMASEELVAGDPWAAAQNVASVVWARVEQEWLTPSTDPQAVRSETLAFCLRGLGASPEPSRGAGAPDRSAGTGRGRA